MALIVVVMAVIVALILLAFFTIRGAADNPMIVIDPVTGKRKPTKVAPRGQSQSIDWDAIADSELQSYLPNKKINAIKRYGELTGAGLKDSKDAIEYVLANPDAMKKGKAGSGGIVDTDGAGVKDLIAEGRIEEAVDVYAAFMGVDEFTARDAIREMQREGEAVENLSLEDVETQARQLVADGKKLNAIMLYRQMTDYSLKEAKEAVERIEREEF